MRGLITAVVAAAALGGGGAAAFDNPPFNDTEISMMMGYFLKNVNVGGNGAVVAAQSTTHPNYNFHWVRDAAICMHVLLKRGGVDTYSDQVNAYIGWVSKVQHDSDPNSGMMIEGEPKYYLSGSVYDQPWCRPQNDGPALRAIALIEVANQMLQKPNGKQWVQTHLYDATLSNPLPVKQDLEFVAHHWVDQCCDPWEEIFGDHFFTKIVQRKALIDGAALAEVMGDPGAAAYYSQQAALIIPAIDSHWNANTGVIEESKQPYTGPPKYNGLDVAVIIGALLGDTPNNATDHYGPTSDRVLSTAQQFTNSLQGVYTVNQVDDGRGLPGFLVGRYPNDTYDGYETGQRGNPWVLCSAAMAELSYHAARAAAAAATTPSAPPVVITRLNQPFYANALAAAAQHGLALTHTAGVVKGELGELSSEASAELSKALVSNGDGIFRRVRFHTTGGELHQPEELNRDTGFEQGAGDLSWSYGGIMSALMARDNAVALL
eukprot:m.454487 g.454487  ORF g.454487 m.454487 type:complete len:490 (-) comp20681_c0_seq1:37-1506(-)